MMFLSSVSKASRVALASCLTAALCFNVNAQDSKLAANSGSQRLSRLVVAILERQHIRKDLEAKTLARQSIELYASALDPDHLYFLESEIAEMQEKAATWASELAVGKFDLPFMLADLYRRRVAERVTYCLSKLVSDNWAASVPNLSLTVFDKRATGVDVLRQRWLLRLVHVESQLAMDKSSAAVAGRYRDLRNYVAKLSGDTFADFALTTWARSYDRYTSLYFPPSGEFAREILKPGVGSIGLSLERVGDYNRVVSLSAGKPAGQSKLLRKGDLIVATADAENAMVPTMARSLDAVSLSLRGVPGSDVYLRVWRSGATNLETVRLKRSSEGTVYETVLTSVVPIETPGGGSNVVLVKLPSLYRDFEAMARGDRAYRSASRDVKKQLLELPSKNLAGVILDLRGNGGGMFAEVADVTAQFTGKAPAVVLKEQNQIERIAAEGEKAYAGPLVVLTDNETAAGAEMLTAALRDNNRAVVIGTETYAHGGIATALPLSRYVIGDTDIRDAQLWLTTGYSYRLNGESLHGNGVVPDIVLGPRPKSNLVEPLPLIEASKDRHFNPAFESLVNRLRESIAKSPSSAEWRSCQPGTAKVDVTKDADDSWIQCAANVLKEIGSSADAK